MQDLKFITGYTVWGFGFDEIWRRVGWKKVIIVSESSPMEAGINILTKRQDIAEPWTFLPVIYEHRTRYNRCDAGLSTQDERWQAKIHSFSSLSYDRSKASSPHSAIWSFLLQITVSSLLLKVTQNLPTSSSSSSYHFYPTFFLSFNNPL